MKFKIPNPKLEDELAMEYLKRMEEEDNWPILRYDDPNVRDNVLYLPTIPQQIQELREEIEQIKLKLKEL